MIPIISRIDLKHVACRGQRLLCASCLSLFAWSSPSLSEWVDSYEVRTSVGYDNNFRLAETDQIETSIVSLSLSANAETNTETTSLVLSSRISGAQYSDSSIDTSSALDLSLGWDEAFVRSSYSVDTSYRIEPTIETELLDTGEIVDGRRDSAGIALSYSYAVSQRTSLSADIGFRDVTYDTDLFIDYQENSAGVSIGYRVDPSSGWLYSLDFTSYEPDTTDSSEIVGTSLGYQLSTSVNTNYNFSLGYVDVSAPDSSETSSTISAGVSNIWDQRNTLTLDITRDYRASGGGDLREQDTLEFEWAHALTDRFGIQSSVTALSRDDRDYEALGIGFGYQFTREVSFSGRYTYRNQQDDLEDASSDSIYLTLSASIM